jgi:phthiocerol/phenolphthiocerol synthesis type-I polyketide synthase E
MTANAIAVVGMAGRFPGANSVSAFWDNLKQGRESIVTISEDVLAAAGVRSDVLANPAYVRRAAILDGIDEFDAAYFGISPHVARLMDPQHRLFLQCAWHALEDAGCDPGRYDGSIGVYGSSDANAYLVHNLLSHYDPNSAMAQGTNIELISLFLNNDKDFLATRVSYQFNLRGPSLTVQTACSSSLVAVHLACQSLLNRECDMALAGGVAIHIPHHVGYWNEPGSMMSPVGRCRPFDIRSDGTVFGSGVAIVALKRLAAAIDDGDRIHAVIRGSAINNDGSMKMGFAAPNATAQADVIAEAHAVAGIDASTVSYVETHGTGTPLGDPIEIEGLRRAFGVSETPRTDPCILGSVKSNIGHLNMASGVAGLVKAILCLKHRAIPATLHFDSPNPELRLDHGPFVVQREYGSWEPDGVRRAGVSSFGVGGTNVHVVLEEAAQIPACDTVPGPQVLLLSARSIDAVNEARAALATELAADDQINMSDVAFTLSRRRKDGIRVAAVVHDRQHAARVLREPEHDNVFTDDFASPESRSGRVIFMFPGQGAQHIGMAGGLYESEPVFAGHFDRCAALFLDELGIDLRAEVFGEGVSDLERTDRAQPALFTVEYALAKLVNSYGIRAAALCGHSIGEFVAAALAGVFDLETAIKAVSVRARLMHASPAGAMVAVPLGPDAVAEYLSPGVDLAAVNDPGSCVIAGTRDAVRMFTNRLAEQGVTARRVRAAHAFHSRSMDAVLPEFETFLSGLALSSPETPLLSNVTGGWLTDTDATDPAMWAQQVRATVRFADELDVMLADPSAVVVEVGPGGSLTASAIRHPRWSSGHRAVRLMRHPAQNRSDRDAFLLGLGQLWSAGIEVDWTPLSAKRGPRITSLPGYPFAHQRHWVDPMPREPAEGPSPLTSATIAGPVTTAGTSRAAASQSGQSHIEATLQRVLAECLGLDSIDVNGNFFDLGGDSLIAVSVARISANEGLDITPQDMYEHPTAAGLAKAIVGRYMTGGLAHQPPMDEVNPPVPPNISHFLEHGVRETGRWRVPMILRLDPKIGLEDVRAVLTAVTNRHDALRLQITERADTWEQHIAAAQEFAQLSARALPEEMITDSRQRREAMSAIVDELIAEQVLSNTPLTATYITGPQGGSCYLGITLHQTACDNASREILVTDIFTAFAQRLAGEEIVLQSATTTWREWSQRCAALVTHPAVLDRRDYWLQNVVSATLRVADQRVTEPPHAGDLTRLSSTLTTAQTTEVDDARRRIRLTMDEILLGTLARTIAHVIGGGVVAVDLDGAGRAVLKPEVDLRRTVGWFTTVYPVPLWCTAESETSATQLLDAIHETLSAVTHYGIGYGLLRYMFAPTARLLAAERPPDIHFAYLGTIPVPPAGDGPIGFDSDTEMSMRQTIPGLGHAIELRVYRFSGALRIDWWYDTRRLERKTAEALARFYPSALAELTRQASESAQADEQADAAVEALTLVDLSAKEKG